MSWIVVDVEADGPAPGENLYSMVCFGAVVVTPELDKTFYGECRPISEKWIPDALAVSGFTREQTLEFRSASKTMRDFAKWLEENSDGKPIFVSDNPCFDYQWINYYYAMIGMPNPFGHSGRRIGDIYSGLVKDAYKGSAWKFMRKTKHSHNPVDDAMGNAEALLRFKSELGLGVSFK